MLFAVFLTELAVAQTPFAGRKFVIDAGHGGTDPGAVGIDGGAAPNEEDFVLDVAQRLKTKLETAGGTVVMTRSTDTTVSLTARRDLANAEDPDAFLSIHCNSFSDPSANGTETFWWTSGAATDELLAEKVQDRMMDAFSLTNRGVKQANFTVLTANPPAALAEMMFISNQTEFDLMNLPATRQAAADAYFQAFADFLGIDLSAPTITAQPANQAVNPGQTASFSVTATGNAGLTYRWQKNGVNLNNGGRISGVSTANLQITNAQFSDAGFYSVRVTGGVTTLSSQQAQLIYVTTPSALGTGSGLRGTYYDNQDFSALRRARLDATVQFDWSSGAPSSTMQPETFSVRWTGQVEPRYSQTYTFYARADDGVRLWVNGSLIIDRWLNQSGEFSGVIALTAGQKANLVMEYYESSGNAFAELRWSAASQVKEIIPSTQLYRPPPQATYASGTIPPQSLSQISPTGVSVDPLLSAQPWADFEAEAEGTTNAVLFRKPDFSGTTSASLDLTQTRETTVKETFPVGNSSSRALLAKWHWASGAVNPWLRLTTFGATTLPNPVIDFRKSLQFDVWSAQPLRLGLGLRETNATGSIGSDGGTVGPIEFVGVSTMNGAAPQAARTLTTGTWQTVSFSLPSEPVRAFTGNGTLDSTSGLGVLEHLNFAPAGSVLAQEVYLDNFVVTELNGVTYNLVTGPAGATVHPTTGTISWTPTLAQSGLSHSFSVLLTDAGIPASTAIVTFPVTVSPNSYARWVAGYPGLTGNAALPSGNSDGDNLPQLLEYALNSDPLSWSPQPVLARVSGGITLTYTRPSQAPDVIYQAEWSSQLDAPVWQTSGFSEQITSDDGNNRIVQVTLPIISPGRKFVRLRVSEVIP
jgi:N-acetylmuramoyl-L-alanine amidase